MEKRGWGSVKGWFQRRRGKPASHSRDSGDDAPTAPSVSRTAGTEVVAVRDVDISVTPAIGHLTVVEGPAGLLSRRFAVRDAEISIGRAEDCYVSIPDPSVSRCHAELRRDGDRLVLVHRSGTNPTFVNGSAVADQQAVCDGDHIQLADRVVLRLDVPTRGRDSAAPAPASLWQAMEDRVSLDERIERQYVRTGSFLDVDVVDSYGLKSNEARPERVVVSFERFRAFIERAVQFHRGQVLNSNGDEVMAFFESADDALAGARLILTDLRGFNEQENLLSNPFRVRVGIHTGRSAVDLESGIAYSPVLDGAGHLQKAARVGGLLLSEETYRVLSNPEGLVAAGRLDKHGIASYSLPPVPSDGR
jgi:pSer/pThr/pTyr-binding forkhead associated (FHA) protein